MPQKSQFPFSKIKVSVPARRPELVTRQRLLEALYERLDKKVIMIAAPAGYGKTSLLMDLANSNEMPVCWLSLDSLDQEPQRFLTYLVACIVQTFPNFGPDSFSAIGNLSSFEQDVEQVIIAITNEIEDKIREHFAIVLDDFHLIDSVPAIQKILSRFIQLSGENVHLIIASRSLPDFPDMPLLVGRDLVAGLSFEEMAFQPVEVQHLFAQNKKGGISEQDAERIVAETEGWVAAIHLMGIQANHRRVGNPFGASSDLFDFFSQEILAKQPGAIREFLLLTSLFDAFDVSLCHAVIDPVLHGEKRNWQSLFAMVKKRILFANPVGPHGNWIRYHHLFRHFLQSQLQFEQPALAWHIQYGLARHFEQQQSWEEALQLYEALGDRNGLVQVFSQAGSAFMRGGRILTLANWLERVPVNLLQESPILLSLQGAVYATQGDTQMAVSLLSQAETRFRSLGDKSNLALTLVRRAVAYRRQGQYELALVDADQAINLVQDSQEQVEQGHLAEARRIKGQILFRLGQANDALQCLQSATHIYLLIGEHANIPILEMEIGMIYRNLGETSTAIDFYNRARQKWDQSGNLGWKAVLLNNLGVLHHMNGEVGQAYTVFEEAIECAERGGDIRTQALALNSLGDLLCDLQELDQARSCYEQASSIAARLSDTLINFYTSLAKARLARLSGQLPLAREILDSLRTQANLSAYMTMLLETEWGCYLLCCGRAADAVETFSETLLAWGQTDQYKLEQGIARLWQAAAMSQLSPDDAITNLEDFLAHAANTLISGPLFVTAIQVQRWLEKPLQSKKGSGQLERFFAQAEKYVESISHFRRQLRQISKRIEMSRPHLEIYAFGAARVIRNGKVLAISDWQTRETRDLFFYFISHPPQTKEEIANVFWPDISPARLKMRFKTSIYRLRQALGQDVILFEDDHYRFNRTIDYTCDRENFEHLIDLAQSATTTEETISLLEKSIDLVNGSYLSDIDADWTMEERAHLESVYQSTLLYLANLYLQVGKARLSLKVCQRALTADPLNEQAHRISMQAYVALRDRSGLIRQFEKCREKLEEELGIGPSRETEKLYERLISEF